MNQRMQRHLQLINQVMEGNQLTHNHNIVLSDEYVENIKKGLPELPHIKKERYINEYKLTDEDARVITLEKYLSEYKYQGM